MSKAVWTMLEKQTIWYWRASLIDFIKVSLFCSSDIHQVDMDNLAWITCSQFSQVDHLASLVSHSSRYLGYPWSAYESIVIGGRWLFGIYIVYIHWMFKILRAFHSPLSLDIFSFAPRVKLEFYVDCLGQFLSMIIWLGWQASVVALVGQVGP